MAGAEMLNPDTRISLAELNEVGIKLRPSDAVTIVRELVLQVTRGEIPGVPSAHVIRLSPSGQLFVEGPVAAGSRPVSRAAQLLDSLLPSFGAAPEFKVGGALRLVLARALGTLDVPPYDSLEAFAEALDRFSPADSAQAIRDLAQSWADAREREATSPGTSAASGAVRTEVVRVEQVEQLEQPEGSDAPAEAATATAALVPSESHLTISDIRRARRATGLPLAEVSSRSRIPVGLLRQLEWGYLLHWPPGLNGRTQLVRYARAAGLDEQLVVATVWPMLQDVERQRRDQPVAVEGIVIDADAEAPEIGEIHLERAVESIVVPPRRRGARAARWLAVAAALLLAVVPVVRNQLQESPTLAEKIARSTGDTVPGSTPSSAFPSAPAPENTATSGESNHPVTPPRQQAEAPPAKTQPTTQVAQARTSGTTGEPDAAPAHGLTDDAVAYSPTFASVGSAMFYHAESRDGSALMRADTDPDGSILRITRVVDDNAHNYHARPSPDGSRIAFDSDREGERAVYIANADGTNVRRISGEGFASVPSWSPDGQRLAFVRAEPDRPRVWNLWTVDLDSGNMRRLTSHPYGQPWGGSWFPDGRRLAYSHEDRLVILDLESGREQVFRSPRKGRLLRTPAVSPDGRLVMFQVYRDGAWLLDLRDESMRKVLADPTAEEYTWSPDGRRVAYHSRRTGSWGVWLMAAR